jgi:hypothetical protein
VRGWSRRAVAPSFRGAGRAREPGIHGHCRSPGLVGPSVHSFRGLCLLGNPGMATGDEMTHCFQVTAPEQCASAGATDGMRHDHVLLRRAQRGDGRQWRRSDRISPPRSGARSQNPELRPVSEFIVALPLQGFVHALGVLENVRDRFTEQGLIGPADLPKAAPASAQANEVAEFLLTGASCRAIPGSGLRLHRCECSGSQSTVNPRVN